MQRTISLVNALLIKNSTIGCDKKKQTMTYIYASVSWRNHVFSIELLVEICAILNKYFIFAHIQYMHKCNTSDTYVYSIHVPHSKDTAVW